MLVRCLIVIQHTSNKCEKTMNLFSIFEKNDYTNNKVWQKSYQLAKASQSLSSYQRSQAKECIDNIKEGSLELFAKVMKSIHEKRTREMVSSACASLFNIKFSYYTAIEEHNMERNVDIEELLRDLEKCFEANLANT